MLSAGSGGDAQPGQGASRCGCTAAAGGEHTYTDTHTHPPRASWGHGQPGEKLQQPPPCPGSPGGTSEPACPSAGRQRPGERGWTGGQRSAIRLGWFWGGGTTIRGETPSRPSSPLPCPEFSSRPAGLGAGAGAPLRSALPTKCGSGAGGGAAAASGAERRGAELPLPGTGPSSSPRNPSPSSPSPEPRNSRSDPHGCFPPPAPSPGSHTLQR